jgi:hypothetical protein
MLNKMILESFIDLKYGEIYQAKMLLSSSFIGTRPSKICIAF